MKQRKMFFELEALFHFYNMVYLIFLFFSTELKSLGYDLEDEDIEIYKTSMAKAIKEAQEQHHAVPRYMEIMES